MADSYDLDKLQAYVEGEMTAGEREAYERDTLAHDHGLGELADDLRADRDALRRLPDEAPPRDIVPESTDRAERSMLLGDPEESEPLRLAASADRRHVWTRRLVYTGVAASVLVAVGLTVYSISRMGVRDLDQWSQGPVASRATPGDAESSPAPGTAPGSAPTPTQPPSPPASPPGIPSPESLARRERSAEPTLAPTTERSAAEPATGLDEVGEVAEAAAIASDALREQPTMALEEQQAPSDAAGDVALNDTPIMAGRANAELESADASAARADAAAAATEPGGEETASERTVRFVSADPASAYQEMRAAARRSGFAVIEADDAPGGVGSSFRFREVTAPDAPLRLVVVAPPQRVAEQLARLDGRVAEGSILAPRSEARSTLAAPASVVAPKRQDADPAASAAAEAEVEAEADGETRFDYAAILIDALPVPAAEPMDPERYAARRIVVRFESTDPQAPSEPAPRSAATADVEAETAEADTPEAEDAQASEPSEPSAP